MEPAGGNNNNDGAGDFTGSEENPYLSLGKSPGILSAAAATTEEAPKVNKN